MREREKGFLPLTQGKEESAGEREKTEVEGERRAWKREERGASLEKAEIARDGKISVARMRGENMERARKERKRKRERGRRERSIAIETSRLIAKREIEIKGSRPRERDKEYYHNFNLYEFLKIYIKSRK